MSCVDSTRPAPPVKDHFSALPNRLQDDPRLKPRDLVTVAGILRYARQKSWASMSNHALCRHGRCEERSIQYSLRRLEDSGWIRREACPDAPGSASGRLIYLTWRTAESRCTPPPQRPAPRPVPPIAPEVETEQREEEPAPLSPGGSGPGQPREVAAVGPSGPVDYAALGWLDRAASDPLRRIAEKALAARVKGPTAHVAGRIASDGPRSLQRAPGGMAAMLGRQLAGRK